MLLNILWKPFVSGFFDEYKARKNNIYLKFSLQNVTHLKPIIYASKHSFEMHYFIN